MTPSPDLRPRQTRRDDHRAGAGTDPTLPNGQTGDDAHSPDAVERLTPQLTTRSAASMPELSAGATNGGDQIAVDIHTSHVATSTPPGPARLSAALPSARSPGLAAPLLEFAADVLDDLERVRVANENRLEQLTRCASDKDGVMRGFRLDVSHPDVARLAALVAALRKAEDDAESNLKRMLREHPLAAFVKSRKGIGEKQGARLLAVFQGDPYWNTLHNRPRRLAELRAYCGYHVLPVDQMHSGTQRPAVDGGLTGGNADQLADDNQRVAVGVAPFRVRGRRSNWSETARMRLFNIAESCIRQLRAPCIAVKGPNNVHWHAEHLVDCACSPYRLVYDAGRSKYFDAVHHVPCVRCGPQGSPAAAGSLLSPAHQHARARRLVARAILKDLWRAARDLYPSDLP